MSAEEYAQKKPEFHDNDAMSQHACALRAQSGWFGGWHNASVVVSGLVKINALRRLLEATRTLD